MAKRKGLHRIESEEVQGEGSYVVMKAVPYRVIREAQQQKAEQEDKEAAAEAASDFVLGLVLENLVEWDWVDYDDEPLPIPKTVDDLDALTAQEVLFLTNALMGSLSEKRKN